MKDTELRALILQKYYEKRREGPFQWSEDDFKDVPDSADFDAADLYRICDQLADHGLINWRPVKTFGGVVGGIGNITASGVDIIEGTAQPPISMTFDHSITVHGSSNVQVGSNNTQGSTIQIGRLVDAIEQSNAPEADKTEAKSRLKRFLEHPLVTSIAGGLASLIKP